MVGKNRWQKSEMKSPDGVVVEVWTHEVYPLWVFKQGRTYVPFGVWSGGRGEVLPPKDDVEDVASFLHRVEEAYEREAQ